MKRIAVAMDNAGLRQRIVSALQEEGYSPVVLPRSWDVLEFAKSNPISIVVLETNDDAALVVRLVYELYRIWGFNEWLPIIPLLSPEQIARNPSLYPWDIDGHDAVACLPRSNDPMLDWSITELVRRISVP